MCVVLSEGSQSTKRLRERLRVLQNLSSSWVLEITSSVLELLEKKLDSNFRLEYFSRVFVRAT